MTDLETLTDQVRAARQAALHQGRPLIESAIDALFAQNPNVTSVTIFSNSDRGWRFTQVSVVLGSKVLLESGEDGFVRVYADMKHVDAKAIAARDGEGVEAFMESMTRAWPVLELAASDKKKLHRERGRITSGWREP